ncbi:hypothetical protein [Halorhabdus rudnickae]|uniref:hypothetical protein n=1 Tax=Halorhabdus rudnickae TaxID=1775544 RepID=UPI001AF01D6E|nr:hypothetical protein [Halorhabdus rudnickae]
MSSDQDAETEGESEGGNSEESSAGSDILNGMGETFQQQQESAEEAENLERNEDDVVEDSGESESSEREDTRTSTDEGDELPPVKDRPRVLTYLPEEFKSTFEIQVSKIKLEWQENGDGREIEKLRHIYPILMKVGVDNAEDLDAEQIGELMEVVEEWDRQDAT